MLPLAAQPQMAMIHQKIDAVFFGRDRIRIGSPERAARSRRLPRPSRTRPGARCSGPNLAAHDQRRFLRQILQRFKQSLRPGCAFTATHCMMPVPSRSSGKTDLAGLAAGCTASRRSPPVSPACRPASSIRMREYSIRLRVFRLSSLSNICCTSIERLRERELGTLAQLQQQRILLRQRAQQTPSSRSSRWSRPRDWNGNRC